MSLRWLLLLRLNSPAAKSVDLCARYPVSHARRWGEFMSGVELHKVRKDYGTQKVIHELDLSVRAGEFMVLVGPSGCGKSTLLRMVAGLEEISAGSISIGGKDVTHLNPKSRGIAMVFQNYALYPHMSVRENLAFSLKLSGVPKLEIEKRVNEAADVLGLREMLAKRPGHLSGGQKQRVAMGRAMVRNPAVFLFDEPLSNLDAQLRVKMRAEISLLHRRLKSTILYVTHDQVEAMTLADRIAILNRGELEQVGAPLEVYHHPKTQFVASFIGTPAMNFLPVANLAEGTFPHGAETVGFRPEMTRVLADAQKLPNPDGAKWVALGKGKVSLVEPLGRSAHVHLQMREHAVVAESETTATPAIESDVEVCVPADSLFFFDGRGRNIFGLSV